jgi:hypothetical protein
MKNMIRNAILSLFLIAPSIMYGGVPPMNVIISDAGGKAAYKGATNTTGAFATTKLKPGNYVVQLNTNSSAVKGNRYTIVVAAGTKKVAANAVPGEKFTGGGVALKVDVGAGLNITGQVAADSGPTSKSGKKMVWIPKRTGSNMPGHWVEEDSAEAKEARSAGNLSTQDIQKIQAHQDQHGG